MDTSFFVIKIFFHASDMYFIEALSSTYMCWGWTWYFISRAKDLCQVLIIFLFHSLFKDILCRFIYIIFQSSSCCNLFIVMYKVVKKLK